MMRKLTLYRQTLGEEGWCLLNSSTLDLLTDVLVPISNTELDFWSPQDTPDTDST